MNRAEQIAAMAPQLVAEVRMYATDEGGRKSVALPGWGCPCMTSTTVPLEGYDGWPQLGDTPLKASDERLLGFVFLSGDEAAEVMRRAGVFYLWEGEFIGEAHVVA